MAGIITRPPHVIKRNQQNAPKGGAYDAYGARAWHVWRARCGLTFVVRVDGVDSSQRRGVQRHYPPCRRPPRLILNIDRRVPSRVRQVGGRVDPRADTLIDLAFLEAGLFIYDVIKRVVHSCSINSDDASGGILQRIQPRNMLTIYNSVFE